MHSTLCCAGAPRHDGRRACRCASAMMSDAVTKIMPSYCRPPLLLHLLVKMPIHRPSLVLSHQPLAPAQRRHTPNGRVRPRVVTWDNPSQVGMVLARATVHDAEQVASYTLSYAKEAGFAQVYICSADNAEGGRPSMAHQNHMRSL